MITKKQLERHKKTLLELRSAIIAQFEAKKSLLEKDTEEAKGDEVDIASQQRSHELSQIMGKRDKNKLDQIQAALEKIENNDFGICDECGEAITTKRLNAMPYTNLCIECKEKEESMGVGNASFAKPGDMRFAKE